MEIAHFITANSNDGFAVDELEALSQSFHGQNCTVVFIIVVGCCKRLCQRRNQKDGSEFAWEWWLDLRASLVAMVFRRRETRRRLLPKESFLLTIVVCWPEKSWVGGGRCGRRSDDGFPVGVVVREVMKGVEWLL